MWFFLFFFFSRWELQHTDDAPQVSEDYLRNADFFRDSRALSPRVIICTSERDTCGAARRTGGNSIKSSRADAKQRMTQGVATRCRSSDSIRFILIRASLFAIRSALAPHRAVHIVRTRCDVTRFPSRATRSTCVAPVAHVSWRLAALTTHYTGKVAVASPIDSTGLTVLREHVPNTGRRSNGGAATAFSGVVLAE